MSKLERLVELIRLTRRRAGFDVREMSRVCGVSQRTIYRYLNTLAEMDIPRELIDPAMVTKAGVGGVELDGDDRCLLRYLLDHNPLADHAFFRARLEKLRRALAPSANGRGRRMRGRVLETGLRRAAPSANARDALLSVFARAARAGREVTIHAGNSGRSIPGLIPDALRLTSTGIQLRFRDSASGGLVRFALEEIAALHLRQGTSSSRVVPEQARKKG